MSEIGSTDLPRPESFTLGGQSDEVDYHPLALDADGVGLWGWIDRCGQRLADWLNPILVKEARQSLKSRQFIITFFLLLAASCFWTIFGVVINAPDVYYVPTGQSLMAGYYFVLAIPLIGMVPLAAHRSLAAEIDDDTFEMLVITRLSAMRIVMGKLNSAMLQMMVYFAAIVPCLAFSYLLRGVSLPTIVMLIAIVFFTALLVTSFSLTLATFAPHRAGQTLALLGLIAVIIFAEFLCAAFCLDGILYERVGNGVETMMFTAMFMIVGGSCIVMFVKAAAARIAPVTENRSTGLRWCMFAQQLLWIAVIAFLALWYEDTEVLNFGTMVVGGYWLVMGTLTLSESPELSPRVQRRLPQTFAGRSLLTWFNPGPGTGYVFAICSGTVRRIGHGGIRRRCGQRESGSANRHRDFFVDHRWILVGVPWHHSIDCDAVESPLRQFACRSICNPGDPDGVGRHRADNSQCRFHRFAAVQLHAAGGDRLGMDVGRGV